MTQSLCIENSDMIDEEFNLLLMDDTFGQSDKMMKRKRFRVRSKYGKEKMERKKGGNHEQHFDFGGGV